MTSSKNSKTKSLFFISALPNEYLVRVGGKKIAPQLGAKRFRWFNKYLRIPAYVQTLHFSTDNANIDYQGIGIEGYANWRIDPSNPTLAIKTLDFFDENNPMAKTNTELRTICVEAVRHLIANMTIDDALKKKDEIADNLVAQLKKVEDKWGILFDQVGIEKVTIMSDRLFADLQSDFRNKLRLEAAKTQINTDKEVANEENQMKEVTELKRLETDKKLGFVKQENQSALQERNLDQQQVIKSKAREIDERNFREEIRFKMEQEEKKHELEVLEKNLEIAAHEVEAKRLDSQLSINALKNDLAKKDHEIAELKRTLAQSYTQEELLSQFISSLPQIYEAIAIENYSVLDSGGEGNVSAIGKILHELMATLDHMGLKPQQKKKE